MRARIMRLLASVLALASCGEEPSAEEPSAEVPDLAWAVVLEAAPDPSVVTDADLRARIAASGLPWRVRHAASGIELLLVPAGEGTRGADESDPEASDDERPAHAIRVAAPFYIGRYEVSQAEWERVTGERPSFFPSPADGARLPVEQVSYADVRAFLAASALELPTESQWEHACRAGDASPRYGATDAVAWHRGNAGGRTRPSGAKEPNALGLHDMLGNVWEWTRSAYLPDEYGRHRAPLDARVAIVAGPRVVLRGGSWYDAPKRARASARYAVARDFEAAHAGVRVIKEL